MLNITTHFKTIKAPKCSVEYFAKLSDYGRKKYSFLLESADIVPKYGEFSLGSVDPCLRVKGNKQDFEILALNKLGEEFLALIKDDLNFCDTLHYTKTKITGTLKPKRSTVSEDERLKLKTHIDIIRTIAFKFKPTSKPFIPYCGLFGRISYDFIDQFENLPESNKDIIGDPDYELYYADNLFLIDHKSDELHLIANELTTSKNNPAAEKRCIDRKSVV